eukprot:366212-Chlamydomonas_euryale.AAC.1
MDSATWAARPPECAAWCSSQAGWMQGSLHDFLRLLHALHELRCLLHGLHLRRSVVSAACWRVGGSYRRPPAYLGRGRA